MTILFALPAVLSSTYITVFRTLNSPPEQCTADSGTRLPELKAVERSGVSNSGNPESTTRGQ